MACNVTLCGMQDMLAGIYNSSMVHYMHSGRDDSTPAVGRYIALALVELVVPVVHSSRRKMVSCILVHV